MQIMLIDQRSVINYEIPWIIDLDDLPSLSNTERMKEVTRRRSWEVVRKMLRNASTLAWASIREEDIHPE